MGERAKPYLSDSLERRSVVRIFLVDDNAMIRTQLRTALEKQDDWVVVGEAEDGRRVLSIGVITLRV